MSDIAHLARAAAERGQRLQKEILELVQGHQSDRQLPNFNIERAASLIGVSTSTLRAYERQEKIPKARVVPAGSVDRRHSVGSCNNHRW